MPKQCPTCLQVYSDHAKFCDRDGATLPEAPAGSLSSQPSSPRRSRMRLMICLALPVIALAAALAVAHTLYQRHLQSRIAISLEGVTLPENASGAPDRNSSAASKLLQEIVGAAKVAIGSGDLIAQIKVDNQTRFSGQIVSANYNILSGDREIGRGSWTASPAPVGFQPGHEFSLELPFRTDPRSTLTSVLDAVAGKAAPVRMTGTMKVKAFLFTFEIPFEARLTPKEKFELPKPQES